MKNAQGFASILLLSLIPVVLAGGLFMFTGFSFLRVDLETLNICRSLQLETQNKTGRNLEALLKLNPKAMKLRFAQKRAEKSLLLAITSGNPVAIASAEARLLKIQTQRGALHIRQRTLIETANATLKTAGVELQRRLLQQWNYQVQPLRPWLEGRLHLKSAKIPTLSVVPDFSELAPVYELVPPFEETQSWNQSWFLELKTRSWATHFFNFHGRFQRSCATSLYSENTTWVARLKKAKSL